MSEPVWALAGVAFLGLTLWFAHVPAPTTRGDLPVATSTHFHLWRSSTDADGTYQVRDPDGHVVAAAHVRYDRVSQVPLGGDKPFSVHYDRDYYLIEPTFDVGAWTGYARFGGDNRHWQTGVRYSPFRVLYGTVGADLAVSQGAAGAGLSVYPPPDYLGGYWDHLGLGAWYMAPFAGGSPSWVYGISFSVH